ncbi:MAG: hypothetical protein R2932_60195 [Caldilineaceae bacterium]
MNTRSTLAALLWPEIGDQSRANLRNTLHRLRHVLDAAAPAAATTCCLFSRQSICADKATTVDVAV